MSGVLLLRDVLGFAAAAGARLAGRDAALERPVTGGNVMQVPTDAFARVGDVVFAPTTVFWSAAAGPATLLEALAARGVAAVALRGPDVEELADALAWTARRHDVPLLLLGARVHLNDVLNELLAALGAPSRADLERGSAVQDQLAELVLGGWELDALPDAIAEVTRDDVVLVGSDGAAIAGSAGADRRAAERVARRRLRAARRDGGSAEPGEEGWIVVPMAAPGGILGHVVARRRKPWDAAALAAVRHGATSAALQLVHQRELESAARRLRTRFVSDLLTGSLEREAARRRALALGWDPSCAFTVLLARREGDGRGEDLLATATRLLASSLVAEHDGGVLAVVPARDRDERPELAAAAALRDAVPGLLVACSLLHDGLHALRDALREAEAALRGVRRFGGGAEIGRYAPQDPLQVLAAVPGRELERFAADQLAPLRELDAESAGVLLRTLEALLASGLNVAETARTGGWHYNTVRYRVRRLTELLGDFMEDGARCQSLALALLLRDARRGAWTPPARSTLSA